MSGNTVQRNTEQINNALNAIQHRRTTTGNELNTNTNQRQILQNPTGRDYTIYVTDDGEKYSTVERAVKSVDPPATFKPKDEQVFYPNGKPNHQFLKQHFIHEGRLHEHQAIQILKQATLN